MSSADDLHAIQAASHAGADRALRASWPDGGRLRNLRREPWLSLVVGEGEAHRAVVADGPVAIHGRPADDVLALWVQRFGPEAAWAVAWLELRPARVYSYTRA